MAKSHSTPIPPFPPDIDRDQFGAWLSGFTDGEGCFMLCWAQHLKHACKCFRATFTIDLRADDKPILEQIQTFLGCGQLTFHARKGRGNAKPSWSIVVRKRDELVRHVIPQFRRHPLRAKKSRDFTIWEQGVELMYRVGCRKFRSRGLNKGPYAKWSPDEMAHFISLSELLKRQRLYNAPGISLPPPERVPATQQTLFDGMP